MHDHPDLLGGPHFDCELLGPDGRLTRLHKGAKAPEQTAAQKKAEKDQQKLMEKMLKQSSKEIEMPELKIPEAPPPVPVSPAASVSSADAEDAAREKTRAEARKMGLLATRFAGATGGYGAKTPMGGKRSLLG